MSDPAPQIPPPAEPPVAPKNSFVGQCPQCNHRGQFTPETLYRWCVTKDDQDFASEPAKHLTRVEALDRNSYDPSLNEDVHVLFASTCPNPACQKPIFLRVEGKKLEFVKIIRQRQGRPHGQSEEDLRLLDLKFRVALPELKKSHDGFSWKCGVELKDLCDSLNRLAPEQVKKRDGVDVASTCKSLLDQLLLKLEARKVILVQVAWLQKRDRWGAFGFMLDLNRALQGRKIFNEIKTEYALAKKTGSDGKFNVEELIDRLSYPDSNARKAIGKSLEKSYNDRKVAERPSISARLYALHQNSLVDRNLWRWALDIEHRSKVKGEEFFSSGRMIEGAAFVRVLADDAFEQPNEIYDTFRMKEEPLFKDGGRVPTKIKT